MSSPKPDFVDGIAFHTIANSEMLQKLGKTYQFAPDKKTGKPKSFHLHILLSGNTQQTIQLKLLDIIV